jgi:hypothetical protein
VATPPPPQTTDVAKAGRTIIRWLLLIGTAIVYAVLVLNVCNEVWSEDSKPTVDKIEAGVMNGIALVFGSAFVGWFGVTTTSGNISLTPRASLSQRVWEIFKGLMSTVVGAAVLAMVIYLAVGAAAGVTYVFNEKQTPTVLVTLAAAWAAQALAVVAATLAAALQPE